MFDIGEKVDFLLHFRRFGFDFLLSLHPSSNSGFRLARYICEILDLGLWFLLVITFLSFGEVVNT